MGKIITTAHVCRLESYIKENHGGKILLGGNVSTETQFVEPTIIENPSPSSLLMTEEIFGPILPLLEYEDINELIERINSKPKPLVVYIFSESSKNIERVEKLTSSGAFVSNDTVMQMLNTHLPFGGVGFSGYGRYHGKPGFDSCSNLKSVMKSKLGDPYPFSVKFPPYTPQNQKMMRKLLKIGKLTQRGILKFLLVLLVVFVTIGILRNYKHSN